jgi:hypothetical protein
VPQRAAASDSDERGIYIQSERIRVILTEEKHIPYIKTPKPARPREQGFSQVGVGAPCQKHTAVILWVPSVLSEVQGK